MVGSMCGLYLRLMQPAFILHDCPIYLGAIGDAFPAWIAQQQYSQVFVIADEHTRVCCLPLFLEATRLPQDVPTIVLPAGEAHKNLSTCQTIWEAMLSANLDRKSLVINLGGGVIGDMGGFCAATWKRGVDFIQVPTTLLAMTDAAIGGKMGVDFQGVKNIIGVFRQPAAVFVDPIFLNTLPERELRSGYAEVIKHSMIGDLPGFPNLGDLTTLIDLLRASIGVKVRIVTEDPQEQGLRMLLNFGHSIGHALESYFLETEAPLTHGEAVAIGMICEMEASKQRDTLIELVLKVFPHKHIPAEAYPAIWQLMLQDKKNVAAKVRMTVPGAVPYTMVVKETTQEALAKILDDYNGLVG